MSAIRPGRALPAIAAALSLSFVCVTSSQAAAKPKTVTACVKKKSGAITVLLGKKVKKKCPKGSTKVTWNNAGVAGANGKNGANGTNGTNAPALKVRNADGTVLGTFAGLFPSVVPVFSVIIDGGSYTYYPSGQLVPLAGDSPVFKDSSCNGTAYIENDLIVYNAIYSKLVGGPTRIVFRAINGLVFGPASAWQLTTTHETVAALNVWERDPLTGACTAAGTSTGELITLASVPAPPDGIGPLTIG